MEENFKIIFVLTKEEIYNAEGFTINNIGIKEEILMEVAGQKMAEEILKITALKVDFVEIMLKLNNSFFGKFNLRNFFLFFRGEI